MKISDLYENFANGRGPGRPGDSQRHGIPKHATIAQLEKAAKSKGRKGQLARWQLNMRRGKQGAQEQLITEADEMVQINGHQIEVLFNPGYQRMVVFAKRLQNPDLRLLYIPSQDVVVVWAAEQSAHYEMAQALQDQLHWNLGPNLRQNMISRRDTLAPISAKFLLVEPMVDSQGRIKPDTNIHRRAGGFAVVALPEFYNLAWWERIKRTAAQILETWSMKYKKSINCNSPRGFSQRAHCAARKKRQAHGKTRSRPVREDLSISQKNLAKKLVMLAQEVKLVPMPTVQGGKTFIVDLDQRAIVLVNLNGHAVPFYCSTGQGGKASVAPGKWYPFWGIGSDGWFNKGTEDMINKFYYSARLEKTAELLNHHLGNLVGNRDVPMAGASAIAMINSSQHPLSKAAASQDLIKYYAGITSQIRAIG